MYIKISKKIIFILVLSIFSLIALRRVYLSESLASYISKAVEQELGTLRLSETQEQEVRAIAKEMGISEPIVIRKMNTRALVRFGYHNAFASFFLLFNFIPMKIKPFLFASEGFFEDLSPEERRFIIGHELIHIKERHVVYLNLVLYLLFFALLTLWWFISKALRPALKKPLYILSSGLLFYISLMVPGLINFAYRRHIERDADNKSLMVLKSHDGGLKLIERWIKEFRMPEHNQYFGLFSDHPSLLERKICCLKFKNKFSGEKI
ncbi:M48 family metalloprotease [Candidatus Babeliales bacterium]|nr:M48 family metalloprotease [Candidatus Babeliales bacterium]